MATPVQLGVVSDTSSSFSSLPSNGSCHNLGYLPHSACGSSSALHGGGAHGHCMTPTRSLTPRYIVLHQQSAVLQPPPRRSRDRTTRYVAGGAPMEQPLDPLPQHNFPAPIAKGGPESTLSQTSVFSISHQPNAPSSSSVHVATVVHSVSTVNGTVNGSMLLTTNPLLSRAASGLLGASPQYRHLLAATSNPASPRNCSPVQFSATMPSAQTPSMPPSGSGMSLRPMVALQQPHLSIESRAIASPLSCCFTPSSPQVPRLPSNGRGEGAFSGRVLRVASTSPSRAATHLHTHHPHPPAMPANSTDDISDLLASANGDAPLHLGAESNTTAFLTALSQTAGIPRVESVLSTRHDSLVPPLSSFSPPHQRILSTTDEPLPPSDAASPMLSLRLEGSHRSCSSAFPFGAAEASPCHRTASVASVSPSTIVPHHDGDEGTNSEYLSPLLRSPQSPHNMSLQPLNSSHLASPCTLRPMAEMVSCDGINFFFFQRDADCSLDSLEDICLEPSK